MTTRAVLLLLLLILSGRAHGEFSWGTGIGVQYGGVLGVQGFYRVESTDTKLKLSLGVIGGTIAIEQMIAKRFSVSAQIFAVAFTEGAGLSANYYFFENKDLRLLAGIDLVRNSSILFSASGRRKDNRWLASFGIEF